VPIDLACFLNFKNVALYLLIKSGMPNEYLGQELNTDKEGRTCFHIMCYKGTFETLAMVMNYERTALKKDTFDQLHQIKQRFKFKNLDIKHGSLVSTVYHDANTIKRHDDFNVYAVNLFEKYTNQIVDRYRSILAHQD